MEGKIKTKTSRGFGFIERPGEEKDLFFHRSGLKNVSFEDLEEGDLVTFEVEESSKGSRAVNVEKTEEEDAEE